MKKRILTIDDDPDILDVLKITLSDLYEVAQASNGEEGLKAVYEKSPDLVIVDFMMPKMMGDEFCRRLKKDILLRHLPIIMLTGKKEVQDKVAGIDAGADDYIVKPFEPEELLARVKMVMRRAESDLDANPLTRLPGNVSILTEFENRMKSGKPFAVCYIDLDKFKVYNDKYGFSHGDNAIRETARILLNAVAECGNPDDFIGHIGGDDFIVVTTPNIVEVLCKYIIKKFDSIAPNLYNEEDRQKGFITGTDRQGNPIQVSLMSVSIGVVTNRQRTITHVGEIGEIGAELKKYAKQIQGSSYIIDRRDATS